MRVHGVKPRMGALRPQSAQKPDEPPWRIETTLPEHVDGLPQGSEAAERAVALPDTSRKIGW